MHIQPGGEDFGQFFRSVFFTQKVRSLLVQSALRYSCSHMTLFGVKITQLSYNKHILLNAMKTKILK